MTLKSYCNLGMIAVVLNLGAAWAVSNSTEVIHSRWGTTTHRSDALFRTMMRQEANEQAFAPLAEYGGSAAAGLENRKEAARATLRLPEVVQIQISRTMVDNKIVIDLVDIDGNRASIWTNATDETKVLDVTGVEPY